MNPPEVVRTFRDSEGRIRLFACPECKLSIIFTDRKPSALAHICKKLESGDFSFLMEIAFAMPNPGDSPKEQSR